MRKYRITEFPVVAREYIVEANSEEEAWLRYDEGKTIFTRERHDVHHDPESPEIEDLGEIRSYEVHPQGIIVDATSREEAQRKVSRLIGEAKVARVTELETESRNGEEE